MTGGGLDIKTADGVMDAFFFTPDGAGPRPAVIMLTDIFGVRPQFEQMGRRLADAGFCVLLPNLYHRHARAPLPPPQAPYGDPAFRAYVDHLRGHLGRDDIRRDVGTMLQWLDGRGEVKGPGVGVVGYCIGGAIALRTAADYPERIAAAASFHGSNLAGEAPDSPHRTVGAIKASLLFGYATDDPMMSPQAIDLLHADLDAAGVAYEGEVYAGLHGFAVTGSRAYDEAASEQHWRAMTAFFTRVLAA